MPNSNRVHYHNDGDDGWASSDYGQKTGPYHNQDDDGCTTTDYGHGIGYMLPSEEGFRVEGSVWSNRQRYGGDDQSDVGKAVGRKREVDDIVVDEVDESDEQYLRGATSDMLSAWGKEVASLAQDYESLRRSEAETRADEKARNAIRRKGTELIQEFDAGTVAGGEGCEEIFQGTWALRKTVNEILNSLMMLESLLPSKQLGAAAEMVRPRSTLNEFLGPTGWVRTQR